MVKEHRYLFDVADIQSLVFTCPKCRQEMTYPLDGLYRPNGHCVSCGEPLDHETAHDRQDPNLTLLVNLRHVLKLSNPSVRVQFVVVDPDNSGP